MLTKSRKATMVADAGDKGYAHFAPRKLLRTGPLVFRFGRSRKHQALGF